jgi:hypothetical protein
VSAERVERLVDVCVLAVLVALLVCTSVAVPGALRVPVVLLFVLLAPGAALARALGLRDVLSALSVTAAAGPALLLVLAVGSLQLGPLHSRAVVVTDAVVTLALLVVAQRRRT